MASAAFEAQFQQNPLPSGGLIFKSEWFESRYDVAPGRYSTVRALVVDPAFTAKTTSDPSAISTWATDGRQYFLIDSIAARLDFPDLVKLVRKKYFELKPHIVLVEAAASGLPLVQSLSQESSLPITGIPPRGDKVARVNAITVLFETNKVVLPKTAPWLDAWMQEHLRFPWGRTDDMVDTTSLGLAWLSEHNLAAEVERERTSRWSRVSTSR
jgi:predicted phage terminase large subunit-like protein